MSSSSKGIESSGFAAPTSSVLQPLLLLLLLLCLLLAIPEACRAEWIEGGSATHATTCASAAPTEWVECRSATVHTTNLRGKLSKVTTTHPALRRQWWLDRAKSVADGHLLWWNPMHATPTTS